MAEDTEFSETNGDASAVPTARMLAWAKNSAAYRLSKRMMTEKQLAEAISRKARQKFEDITDEQVTALVRTAVQFGYDVKALDDTTYAQVRTRSSQRVGKSRKAIRQTLVQKGVAREIADEAVSDADDLRAAVIYARRRAFGPFRKVGVDERQKAKELSAFARQGFSYEIGNRIFAMDRDEADELLLDGPMF
ncbi:recombination regulator RecX [Rhizobium helianthi]|uniref:Regulatory protein RecX n=1 Tax=Rhizobium helianthi TaxID=1132695 RepID=A0ABW4M0J0_9HYPH